MKFQSVRMNGGKWHAINSRRGENWTYCGLTWLGADATREYEFIDPTQVPRKELCRKCFM